MKEPAVVNKHNNEIVDDPSKTKVSARKNFLATESSDEPKRSFVDSEDAKETVVWFIIKFILILCGCVCCVIVFTDVVINKKSPPSSSQQLISDIKSLWETFSSILTLSLGYLFGKGNKKNKMIGG